MGPLHEPFSIQHQHRSRAHPLLGPPAGPSLSPPDPILFLLVPSAVTQDPGEEQGWGPPMVPRTLSCSPPWELPPNAVTWPPGYGIGIWERGGGDPFPAHCSFPYIKQGAWSCWSWDPGTLLGLLSRGSAGRIFAGYSPKVFSLYFSFSRGRAGGRGSSCQRQLVLCSVCSHLAAPPGAKQSQCRGGSSTPGTPQEHPRNTPRAPQHPRSTPTPQQHPSTPTRIGATSTRRCPRWGRMRRARRAEPSATRS